MIPSWAGLALFVVGILVGAFIIFLKDGEE